MPSLAPLMHSILDRLLQLLPDEPRAAKLLTDIHDSDARLGRELFDRALAAAAAEEAPDTSIREVAASGIEPQGAQRRAAS